MVQALALSNSSEVDMAVTLAQVVALSDLGLRVVTRSPSLDRPLRWVAPSEQTDPTPWIEAGDLVLTTGMAMTGSEDECRHYIGRLVQAAASGIGFGVGLHHAEVPEALIAEAERQGLPVLEVPQPVPFVAVSRAVSELQAAVEYAESGAAFDSQRRMIRAVLSAQSASQIDGSLDGGGSRRPSEVVVSVLARHLQGFALYVDPMGAVHDATPANAAGRADELRDEISRLRPRGLLASAALSSADEHLVIVPVGLRETVRGFLIAGSPRALSSADQAVLNLAVSLVSWASAQPLAVVRHAGQWKALLVDIAQREGLSIDRLRGLGLGHIDPARGVAIMLRARPSDGAPAEGAMTVPDSVDALICPDGQGRMIGLASVDSAGQLPQWVLALAEDDRASVVGVSSTLDLTDAANVRQALVQAEQATRRGRGVQRFTELPERSVGSLIDAATAQAWAKAYLEPLLMAPEGTELRHTLRAWLAHHGQIDSTAQHLGIHRHTVRHRLRRAEGILDRSLDDPGVRADLWFAFASLEPGVETGPDTRTRQRDNEKAESGSAG